MVVVIGGLRDCKDTKFNKLEIPTNTSGLDITPPKEVADYFMDLFETINKRSGLHSYECLISYRPKHRKGLEFSLNLMGFDAEVATRTSWKEGQPQIVRDPAGNERIIYKVDENEIV